MSAVLAATAVLAAVAMLLVTCAGHLATRGRTSFPALVAARGTRFGEAGRQLAGPAPARVDARVDADDSPRVPGPPPGVVRVDDSDRTPAARDAA